MADPKAAFAAALLCAVALACSADEGERLAAAPVKVTCADGKQYGVEHPADAPCVEACGETGYVDPDTGRCLELGVVTRPPGLDSREMDLRPPVVAEVPKAAAPAARATRQAAAAPKPPPQAPALHQAASETGASGSIGLVVLIATAFVFGGILQLSPGINASMRGHHDRRAIWVLTLLLGWTGIGWCVALVWSWTTVRLEPGQAAPVPDVAMVRRVLIGAGILWLLIFAIGLAVLASL